MEKPEYVVDRNCGESLGLQYPYLLTCIKGQYLLFQRSDGKIVERLPPQEQEWKAHDLALKRLYAKNGLEQTVSDEMKQLIDETP